MNNLRGSLNNSGVSGSSTQSSPRKLSAGKTNIGSALNDPTLLQNGAAQTISAARETKLLRQLKTNSVKEEWGDDDQDDDDDFVPTTPKEVSGGDSASLTVDSEENDSEGSLTETAVENTADENEEDTKSNSNTVDTTSSMIDTTSFTQHTTICQDDPNFIQNDKNCEEYVKGDVGNANANCEVELDELVKESEDETGGSKGGKVKDVCKRSCGLCHDDEDVEKNEEEVTELEGELKEDDDDLVEESLVKDGKQEGMDEETNLVDNEGVQKEEISGDENASEKTKKKKNKKKGGETDEEEEFVFKKADEDDAFLPEGGEAAVEVKDEGANVEKVEKDMKDELLAEKSQGGNKEVSEEIEDLDTAQKEQETETNVNADEEEGVVSGKDDQQIDEEIDSELNAVPYEDTFDDDKPAGKIEKEMEEILEESIENDEEELNGGGKAAVEDDEEKVVDESLLEETIDESPSKEDEEETEVAPKTEDESVLCQDDPTFQYKGYEGFDCAYIKEKKPDKCNKKHDGVKVGLSSCPVSCDMVDECMALQKQKNDAVVTTTGETATEKSVEVVETDEKVPKSEEEEETTAATAMDSDNGDESEASKEQKDDLQLEKEMETELEIALEEGTVDEETAAKLDEEMFEALEEGVGAVFEKELEEELGLTGDDNNQEFPAESSNATVTVVQVGDNNPTATADSPVIANLTVSEEDPSAVCQDDPDFKFKGYEGFNCEYIKENKPEKCNKKHEGVTLGILFCPVSCNVVDECMALQESKVNAALENVVENDETGSNEVVEEDTVATGTTAEDTIDEGTEDALGGKEDDEASDETIVQVVEGSDDTQVGAVGNTTEAVTSEKGAAVTENDEGEEVSADEKSVEIEETTTGLCQDDPDFKFKGYDGFNCAYIKENKPEKCNKIHNGEKVGIVSCPVSCNMVSECMALQEQKGSADDTQIGAAEDETTNVITEEEISEEMTKANAEAPSVADEEETNEYEIVNEEEGKDQKSATTDTEETTVDEPNDETISSTGVCQDDPDFKFKGYDEFNCEYIKENKPEKCNKLHNGEKVGVVSCPVSCNMVSECMALQQVKESGADDVDMEENDESVGGETGSKDTDEPQVDTQATTASTETQQGDSEMDEDQSLNDQELEQEIEAKLEKALEEGELDEDEAEELEVEMEEALEEGVGEIFEAELDKELRCKDDPEFATVDEDGQLRNCSWVRQNQRCEHIHEYTGKVIGKFFCPETCGMEEECEKMVAADSTLQLPQDTTSVTEEDDMFEPEPKNTKSMADEIDIEIESEFENGNSYGDELSDNTYAEEKDGSFNNGGKDMYDDYTGTENLNQWDNNMDGLPAAQEYYQEQQTNSYVDYSQPTNGIDNWQGYGGENQQQGSFDNNAQSIDYDENWLEDDGGFPFGLLILLFLGVGFLIFRKSQNSSRMQENSRGGYQRVGPQEHNKRY